MKKKEVALAIFLLTGLTPGAGKSDTIQSPRRY